MQTYTHFGIGLLAAQIFYPLKIDGDIQNIALQNMPHILVAAGSLIPDIPVAVKYAKDKLGGKRPFEEMGKFFLLMHNIAHSFIIWLFFMPFFPIFAGVYSHLLLDWPSHSGKKYEKIDASFLWPLPYKLRGCFEYRKALGQIYRPFEVYITILFLSIYILVNCV